MGPRPRGRGIAGMPISFFQRIEASMGPRPRGRGIAGYQVGTVILCGVLQWGRDRAVAELYDAGAVTGPDGQLQWGRDRAVAELRERELS